MYSISYIFGLTIMLLVLLSQDTTTDLSPREEAEIKEKAIHYLSKGIKASTVAIPPPKECSCSDMFEKPFYAHQKRVATCCLGSISCE